MNTAMRCAITGVGLWLPHYPSATAWAARERADDETAHKPSGRAYDRVNRRRASHMGRAIGDAIGEAMAQAGCDPETVPTVIGSSIGEATAMIGLLDQMWRVREPMSPAVFTVSVHNAASGLLSISMKNRGFTTSIAADYDTPAAALFEAMGLLANGHPQVAIACADEASPRSLLAHAPHWDMLAAAVVLAPAGTAGALATVAVEGPGPVEVEPPQLDADIGHNPQVGLVDLIDAVQRRAFGHVALDRGHGRGYRAALERA